MVIQGFCNLWHAAYIFADALVLRLYGVKRSQKQRTEWENFANRDMGHSCYVDPGLWIYRSDRFRIRYRNQYGRLWTDGSYVYPDRQLSSEVQTKLYDRRTCCLGSSK